jgi:hypothetical protein
MENDLEIGTQEIRQIAYFRSLKEKSEKTSNPDSKLGAVVLNEEK